MLSGRIVRNVKFHTAIRWFTCSNVTRDSKVEKNVVPDTTKIEKTEQVLGARMHQVTNFDKRILVWVKRYPSIADVPNTVTEGCMQAARSKARIKSCNYMIIVATIGCICAALTGKRQAAQGESIFKQREEWYQEAIKEK